MSSSVGFSWSWIMGGLFNMEHETYTTGEIMETWMRLCFALSQGSHSSQVVYEDYFTWQRAWVCKLIHHSLCQLFVSELGLDLKCHLPDAQLLVIMLIYYPDWLVFTEHLCGKLLEGELELMLLRCYPWLLAQSAWLCVCVDSTAVENTHMFFCLFCFLQLCKNWNTQIHQDREKGFNEERGCLSSFYLEKACIFTGACLVSVVTTRFCFCFV